jgi:S-methyl-5-thioribose-1-phosphate isomerase
MPKNQQSVWAEGTKVFMIEQNLLPFQYQIFESESYAETCRAIKEMITRGAGSIGAAAGFAMMQAAFEAPVNQYTEFIRKAKKEIEATRPTARDLFAATERVFLKAMISKENAAEEAQKIADEIAEAGRKIGIFGNELIHENDKILTHCNAGWLALVENGSALAPVYEAFRRGKNIFVYADETRPRAQGARLTAWELNRAGIEHAIIPDNAAAWYMSKQKINIVIVGADRIAANGDTANKIGTLEKAICAREFGIPFYVAAPSSTFDFECKLGEEITIEERAEEEVLYQTGPDDNNILHKIRVASPGSRAVNPAFDVTPAKYITGFITEKGILKAEELIKLKK